MEIGFNIIQKKRFNSFLDKVIPEIKIISFFILSFAIFFAPGFSDFENSWKYWKSYSLIIILVFIFIFSFLSKIKFKYYFSPFKIILFFLPLLYIFTYLTVFNWEDALVSSLDVSLRIYILLFSSSILILSSTELEISNGIETLISPLKYLKIPTREISLMISLGIRYIPILLNDAKTILEAQATRGNDYKTGGILTKFRSFINLLNPLVLSAFFKAEETSNAMYIRGYRKNQERKIYRNPQFYKIINISSLLYFLLIFSFVIISRII